MGYFLRKEAVKAPNYPVWYLLDKGRTTGEVGIEIEVEGNKFPKPAGSPGSHKPRRLDNSAFWSYVKDGSLRGEDNAEYVLNNPIPFSSVNTAVSELTAILDNYGSVLADSNRTSVHVHLNCQTFYMNRMAAFTALYFCFEEVLTEWCGEHRVGNLFCLRGKDAPGIVTKIRKWIENDGKSELTEGLHYSGLNAHALTKFGSLEVRTMRGPTDLSIVTTWVEILQRLYEMSAEFYDPCEIPALFSQSGPMAFFETILGDKAVVIRNGIEFDEERIRDSMYSGIRLAQDLCYCRDWTNFKETEVRSDPFGRKTRKLSDYVPLNIAQMEATYNQLSGVTIGIGSSGPPSPYAAFATVNPGHYEPAPEEDEEEEQDEIEAYDPDLDEEF